MTHIDFTEFRKLHYIRLFDCMFFRNGKVTTPSSSDMEEKFEIIIKQLETITKQLEECEIVNKRLESLV